MTQNTVKHISKPAGAKAASTILIFGLLVLLAVSGCKNPLVGLGPRVDLNPPEGTTSGISNGDYVSGNITLTGTIEDDKEVESVWALIEGVIVPGIIDPDGTWGIDLDTTDTAYDPAGLNSDGEHSIIINLRDASGKVTEKQMLLFFDNTPPVLVVTSPDLISPQDTTPIVIRGEAYDPIRLNSVTATVLQGTVATPSPVNEGTKDSWLFQIDHSISGSETLGIEIVASDEAGNTSTAVFHTKDLRYLNNDISITVIDLYNLVDNNPLAGATITPVDVDESTVHAGLPSGSSSSWLTFGAGINGLPIDVDMSGDIPQITITTPNPNIALPGDTMGPASKVNGSISDNVEVNENTVEIRFLESDGFTESITWAPVTILPAQIVNDQNINFSYSLPGSLVDANYFVQVKVRDNNDTEGITSPIPFRLDGNAPVIEITAPALSSYIPDTSTLIEGTAFDSESILVEISLDGTNWENVGTLPAPGGSWSYQISDWEAAYPLAPFSDFDTIPISSRATANGTTTYTNHSLILDRVAPVVEFLTPADSRNTSGDITGDINGVVTLRVAVSDDSLDSVSHQIGISGPIEAVDSGSLYNWSELIVTPLMENTTFSTQISPGIWELPVTVIATDKAGNTTATSDYTLIIDNAQDRPNVSIIYPIEGESYGGEATVSGIATDDDGSVGAVKVQLDLDTLPGEDPDWADTFTFTDGIDFDGNGLDNTIEEYTVYTVTGLSSWSFPLNTTGELYSTDAFSDSGTVGHNGDIYAKIWAEDPINSSVISVPQVLHFRLDDTLPRIDQILLDGIVATSNTYVSGNVDLKVTTSDDTEINKLEISYNNGVDWVNLLVTPGQTVVETVAIDTAAEVAGGNGILYLRLKATDNTGYTTLEVLPLNVDNNDPEGTYPGDEPVVLNGTESLLQGTAVDPNGSIAGVDRIEVYLERQGLLYDPLSTYAYTKPATPDIATEETTFGAGVYYPADPTPLDILDPLPGVIYIDAIYEQGDDDTSGDGDGYDESLTLIASTWNWWVKINSENIPDGNINIHYVIVDKAGNKTHYLKPARIENNPPIIESFLLGTDVNYNFVVDQDVGDGETFLFADGPNPFYPDTEPDYPNLWDRPVAISGITTRNSRLFIDADASTLPTDGNGDSALWLWELFYKTDTTNRLGVNVDSTTISDFTVPVSMPDEAGVSFTLRVTDDAGLFDEVEILLNLDNTDSSPPDVTLYDLNLNHSSIIDARDGVGDLDGYAVPGYLPADEPLWLNAQGRMRPQGVVVYDGDDADVSGKIIISGLIDDDKAIHELKLTVNGYNGGLGVSNPFTILDWDSTANSNLGGLKVASTVIGTPHISSESYGESSGHTVSWSFELDTADILNGGAANVLVTAVATDKTSNTNTPDPGVTADNFTMDVMPFITELQRNDAGINPVLRTRFGSWPFPETAATGPIWIYGFNLNPDAGTVRLVNSADTQSEVFFADPTVHSSGKLEGTLSVDDGGGTEIPITHSGRLTFEVNGIPLMNDWGDFDEDDGDHPYWTDDRYVEIWKVGDNFTDSDYAVYAAMDVDISDGSFMASWSHWSSSSVYTAPQGGARTQRFYRYDPPEYTDIALNDDGRPYVAFLANFLGGTWGGADSGGVALWSANASDAPTYGGNAAEEADAFLQDTMLWQFRNPRIAVTGDNAQTDIYMTYFDQASNALKFSHFRDINPVVDSIYNLTLYPVAEGNDDSANNWNSRTNNPNFIRDYNLYDYNIINDGNVSSYYGTWSDVAVDTRVNAPVILFTDTGSSAVRLMRATSMSPVDHDVDNLMDFRFVTNAYVDDTGSVDPNDDAVFDWHDSQEIFSGDSYKYVSLVFDPDGNLHASAYKISTGELVYRYADRLDATLATDPEEYDFEDVEVVDSVGNVGKWAELSLVNRGATAAIHDYYPVISYMDSSWIGTYKGLKVARKTLSGWESGVVPIDTSVEEGRLSIEGSLYGNLITTDADDYELGVGFHSTSYEFVHLRPEQ